MMKEKREKEFKDNLEQIPPHPPANYPPPPFHSLRARILARRAHIMGRKNVVMTRLSDDVHEKLDALVEIEAFKSVSEAAAFFIREGIEARKDIVDKVMPTIDKIKNLRMEAKESLGISKQPKDEEKKNK